MFKTNELFVDSCTLTAKFSFCVFIFGTEYAMTCHETKDNPRLVDLYPFLKHHNNSGIFSFLYIVFYWNNNLKLCFSLADTAVKKQVKIYLLNLKEGLPCLFSDFFKIQNYCFASPTVLYAGQT